MARTIGSDEVYTLIHSLTTEEKGYFKKFALRHTSEGNRYLELFEAINQQKVFEEASLRKRFKDFSALKNYLKEMILQGLLLSSLGGNEHQQIDTHISFARILISKGLGKAAQKLIEEGIRIADSSDFFDKKLLLLGNLNALQLRQVPPAEKWTFIADRYKQELDVEQKRSYLSRLLFEQRKTIFLIEERNTGRPYKHLISKIDIGFLENEKHPVSNRIFIVRYNTLGAYYDLTNHTEKGFKTLSKNLALVKKLFRDKSNLDNSMHYAVALINYCTFALASNHLKEAETELANLPKLSTANATSNTNHLLQYIYLTQELAFKKRDFGWGVKETMRHLSLPLAKQKMTKHLTLVFGIYKNLALLHLFSKNYTQVYIALQDIFNLNKVIKSVSHETDALLLNIILQIEMGNYELLPSLISAAKRAAKGKKTDKCFEQIIRLLAKYKGDNKIFETHLLNKAYDYMIFEKFNFRRWMKAKAENRNFAIALDMP